MTFETDDKVAEQARAWIVRLASGEMTETELTALKAWLAASPAHRRAFEEARAFWQRLSALEPAFDRAEQRVPADVPRPRRLRAGVAAALSLAACVLLALFLPSFAPALRADYASGATSTLSVTLADGSRVTLDRNTALAVHFGEAERRVELLRGQAFFEVRRDPARPFRVVAGGATAEAVGTAYTVGRAGDRVRVAVSEGRVAVAAEASPGQTVALSPGEALHYTVEGALGGKFALDSGRALAWREGRVVFKARPLREALAELEHYHPGRILLLGNDGRFRPVSGVIDLEKLDQGLAALAATHGLSVIELTPYLTVLR